jgi:hypothetical protein
MGDTVDVNKIIEEFEEILRESETRPWGNSEILYSNAVDALRKLQTDLDVALSYIDQHRLEIERLQGHLAVEARIRLELVESSKQKQAKIETLKKEAALQRLSDFTQTYDAKKHGAEE